MKEIVDIGILSENRCHGNVHDVTSAAFKNDNMQTDFGINDDSKCNISDIKQPIILLSCVFCNRSKSQCICYMNWMVVVMFEVYQYKIVLI